jgi:hypothetical protein
MISFSVGCSIVIRDEICSESLSILIKIPQPDVIPDFVTIEGTVVISSVVRGVQY